MYKFYCPSNCEHGDITKCDVDNRFSDDATFTNESEYLVCLRKQTMKCPIPSPNVVCPEPGNCDKCLIQVDECAIYYQEKCKEKETK